MADQKDRKSNFISRAVTLSAGLLALARDCEEMALYRADSAFQAGGANAITDADCVGANAHMSAALLTAVATIFGQLGSALTPAMRASLRQASINPDV